jgi:hypothetical protein
MVILSESGVYETLPIFWNYDNIVMVCISAKLLCFKNQICCFFLLALINGIRVFCLIVKCWVLKIWVIII